MIFIETPRQKDQIFGGEDHLDAGTPHLQAG